MNEWIKRKSFPFQQHVMSSQPVSIEKEGFLIAATTFSNDNPQSKKFGKGIYKYITKENKWSKHFKYNNEFISNLHSIAADKTNELIYILTGTRLFQFDLKLNSIQTLLPMGFISCRKMISVSGNLHFLMNKSIHYILNKKEKKLKRIHDFNHMDCNNLLGNFIHLKMSNKLILFDSQNNFLYEYNIDNEIWIKQKFQYTFPGAQYLHHSGIVITANEKYIITVGGIYTKDIKNNICASFAHTYTRDILVFNTDEKKWYKSKITCPYAGVYQAIINYRHDIRYFIIIFYKIYYCLLMNI